MCKVSIALPSAVNVSCQWSLICCSLSISQISCLSSTSPVDDLSLAVPWPFCVLEFEQHAVLYLALCSWSLWLIAVWSCDHCNSSMAHTFSIQTYRQTLLTYSTLNVACLSMLYFRSLFLITHALPHTHTPTPTLQVKSRDHEFESIPHLIHYFQERRLPLVIGNSTVHLYKPVVNAFPTAG